MLNGRLDWLWPSSESLGPESEAAARERAAAMLERLEMAVISASSDSVDLIEGRVRELAGDEESRNAEVGTKLTTVLGFFAIAASFGIAVLAVAHGDLAGRLHGNQCVVAVFVAIVAFYIELQLVAACLAGLRGLERQGYPYFELDDAIPQREETNLDVMRRRTVTRADMLLKTESIVNLKVSHMAVAHMAIRNAVYGLLLLMALLCLLLSMRVLENRVTPSDVSQTSGETTLEQAADSQPLRVMPPSTADIADSAGAPQVADTSSVH